MISKKYRNDYHMEYERGPDGRLRDVVTYVGPHFSFVRDLPGLKRQWLWPSLAAAATLLLQLMFTDLYLPELRPLSLPAALCAPALMWVAAGIVRLVTLGENRMTRQQKDKICSRLPAAAFVYLLCAAACFFAAVWGAIALGAAPARLLYAVDALAQAAAAVILFRNRRGLAVREEE